jgi:transposase
MANILKVNEQNTIQQLAAQGWSRRRIARELKLDRKTVRRYLNAAAKSPTISTLGSPEPAESKSPISTPGEPTGAELVTTALEAEAGRPSFCDPHRARIEAKLDAGLSAQRIHQDLVTEVGFSGSYQSVKRFVRQLRRQQPERV